MEGEIEILKHDKNRLMSREEFMLAYSHTNRPTPARKDMIPHIAKKLGFAEELIIVDKIFNVTGKSVSHVKVLAYKKKEEIPQYKLEKMHARITKEKKEAKPKEEKAEKPEKAEAKAEKPAKE